MLLPYSTYEYGTEEIWYDHSIPVIELSSPKIYSEALAGLPEWEQKRIAEAIHNTHIGERSRDSAPDRLVLKTIDSEVEDSLYAEILIHRNQLVAVSILGPGLDHGGLVLLRHAHKDRAR